MPNPVGKDQKKLLKILGQKFKSLREEKGLSLQDVATVSGKDRQSIHRFENGDFNPSFLYLTEVCKGLEIELEDLLRRKH